jgi:hypothetical protein
MHLKDPVTALPVPVAAAYRQVTAGREVRLDVRARDLLVQELATAPVR